MLFRSTSSAGNPFIDLENGGTEYEFDLETDVNGEVATGVYSVNYYVQSVRNGILTSCDTTTIYVDHGTSYNANTWSNPGDIAINISGAGGSRTLTYGEIVSVNDEDGNDLGFEGNTALTSLAANSRIVTLNFRSLNVAFVYTGCTKVTQDIGFTYDCDTDPTGSWSVYSNTPTPSGVTVGAATGTIEWPSWTGEPNITVSSLPYSNTALATGTYGATISQVVTQVIQSSPLLEVEYTLTETYEWKVTCAGSLCELNACIESLRSAHEAELLRNKISKYQPYVDNVAIYLHEAQNYKSCGEFDKYRETLAKVKANLDASGCDCGCCDDNEYKWVAVSPATSTFINNIMSEIQFRVGTTANRPTSTTTEEGKGLVTGAIWHDTSDDKLYKATVTGSSITWAVYFDPAYINTATNGLTESPAGTVNLGGSLISDTVIGLGAYDFTIESSTGSTTIAKDAASSSTTSFPLNITAQFATNPTTGGVGFIFVTQEANLTTYEAGRISSLWTTYSSESKMQFSVMGGGVKPAVKFVIYGSTGTIQGIEYGQGSLVDNTVNYVIGVNSSGEFKEVLKSTIGTVTAADNGLSLSGTTVKLGGSLTAATTITTTNTNTLAIAGLQPGTAASFVAIDGSNKLITTAPVSAPKVISYRITQSGISNPSVTATLVNDLGVNVTFTYGSVGIYNMDLPSGQAWGKTVVTLTNYGDPSAWGKPVITQSVAYGALNTNTGGRIYTTDINGVGFNGLLNAIIKFEFYS